MEANAGICLIGELPDELLVAVASQLQVERGFLAEAEAEEERRCRNAVVVRSLHALTLSCRKFNAIANPLLYKCIIRTERLMTLLLRTLLHDPKLGQHIQYFEATSFQYYDRELHSFYFLQGFTGPTRDKYLARIKSVAWIVPELGSAEHTAFQAGQTVPGFDLTRISEPTLQRIQKQIRLSYYVALVVLLSFADNLQDIAIEDCIGNIINLALSRFRKPGMLRRLWLLGNGRQSDGYLLRFMCSDAIDPTGSLAHYLRSLFLPESMWSEFGPPSAMGEISFTIQDADQWTVDDHLRGCASLKAFSCRWQWTDQFIPWYPVDPPQLHRSLERFHDSLTHLTIDTTESAWRVDIDTFVPALGSLRDFKVLTYLDVAALVLWGNGDFWEPAPLSALLPESLESLIIKTEWNEDVEDILHRMSMDCATSLPKLRRVDCTWRPAPGFIADLLIDACQLAGVDLVLDVEDS